MRLLPLALFALTLPYIMVRAQDDDDDDDEGSVTMGGADGVFQDTELTTNIWRICSTGQLDQLRDLVAQDPSVLTVRSGDGRGALWWAYEYGQDALVQFLLSKGARADQRDNQGYLPQDVPHSTPPKYEAPPVYDQATFDDDDDDDDVDEDDEE